jgi:hypothetical protein
MRRHAPWLAGGRLAAGGLAGIALALIWAWVAGEAAMPSYLAAWLFWSGLPLGALTMVMILDAGGGPAPAALRALTQGVPVAALLFVPMLCTLGALYPWTHGARPGTPFGDAWLHGGYFVGRSIVYLAILALLALRFARPRDAGERRGAAILCLFVAALAGTLAGVDWFMSLDPAFHSGAFGLLIMSLQCAVAVPAALLFAREAGAAMTRGDAVLLAAVGAGWLFLHFTHFLVIWSGNLPREAAWYLARDADAGRVVEWGVFLAGFVLPVALLAAPRRRLDALLPPVAALALLGHMAEALWFVTPAARGHFALRGPDVLMLAGLGGIALGVALPRPAAAGRDAAPPRGEPA